jgi:hypothetical protein
MAHKLITKITVKTVYGKIDREKLYQSGVSEIPIMRVGGTVTGLKSGNSDYGEFTKLTGTFQAINAATGEIFVSGVAILPNVVNDMARGLVQPGQAASFLFDIVCTRDDSSGTGYVYNARSPIEPSADNALTALFSSAGDYKPQTALPPPMPEADKGPEPSKKK